MTKGLISGETACLDDNPNRDLFFVKWHAGKTPKNNGTEKEKDNHMTVFVLCYVKDKCIELNQTVDIWLFKDAYGMIVKHHLDGEYKVDTHNVMQIRWSRQLAPARIPVTELILLRSVTDLRDYKLNTIGRYLFSDNDMMCTHLMSYYPIHGPNRSVKLWLIDEPV